MDTQFFIKGSQLLISLSILVILHELGHFIPAKIFKTRVEKFFLFFDVKFALFKKKIGDTVYGIGWLPLGGYVKISGMVDESMDAKQLEKPAKSWEFRSKPAWQRLIIMLGGITVNILLAFIIYSAILYIWGKDNIDPKSMSHGLVVDPKMEIYGFQNGDLITSINGKPTGPLDINKHLLLRDVSYVNVVRANGVEASIKIHDTISNYIFKNDIVFGIRTENTVDRVLSDSPASKIGLVKGDRIIGIDSKKIMFSDQAVRILKSRKNDNVDVSYVRAGDTIYKSASLTQNGMLGVQFKSPDIKIIHKDYSLLKSIVGGFGYGMWSIHDYIVQLKFLFTKKGSQSIGGLGSIANIFPSSWNWQLFWERTALLSVILAVMNLLPIPALDGGHVVFLIFEMCTGRKPRQKLLEYAQVTGFVILMSLMVYANGKDIYNYFIK